MLAFPSRVYLTVIICERQLEKTDERLHLEIIFRNSDKIWNISHEMKTHHIVAFKNMTRRFDV